MTTKRDNQYAQANRTRKFMRVLDRLTVDTKGMTPEDVLERVLTWTEDDWHQLVTRAGVRRHSTDRALSEEMEESVRSTLRRRVAEKDLDPFAGLV